MYLLDKADLFSLKASRREQRIKEIFELRKKDLDEDTKHFDLAVRNKMREQRIAYERYCAALDKSLDAHDSSAVSEALDDLAAYFNVKLPYHDTESFVDFVKNNPDIKIGY